MFPEAGGQYIFIREAYGRFAAFLYGWVLFTAGNSGALAAMAIAFALFFGRAFPDALRRACDLCSSSLRCAVGTHPRLAHCRGLDDRADRGQSTQRQNGGVAAERDRVGLSGRDRRDRGAGIPVWPWVVVPLRVAVPPSGIASISLKGAGVAMIALLWTFDGWEFLSWVAGEIKDPHRNLPWR